MSTNERNGWQCRNCFEQLEPQSLIGWRRLLWIIPVRTFRCPHCFNTFQKPVSLIAAIPFVGRLFCEKRGMSRSVLGMLSSPYVRGKKSRRNYVNVAWFMRFARWAGRIESKISVTLGGFFRTFLWPFHWFSKTFLGASEKSQRSDRSKSRKRSRRSNDE